LFNGLPGCKVRPMNQLAKKAYRKPGLQRLGLLRRLTRLSF
jgi:hypothetical protein